MGARKVLLRWRQKVSGATEQPGLEIAQVEEGKKVDGDERNGVEDQHHLRDALPEQHLHLPLSIPPGGGGDVSSDREGVAIGHTALNPRSSSQVWRYLKK